MNTLTPGTLVTLEDPDVGTWHGRVVVCLCKRHKRQQNLPGGAGPGTECGHAQCGYPPAAEDCPWPLHIKWDNGDQSHTSGEGLIVRQCGIEQPREMKYSAEEWVEAYNRANDHEFDEIDSVEQGGVLVGVVAELRNDEAELDENMLWAAIDMAGKLAPEYDRSFLVRVMQAYDEPGSDALEDRAVRYISKRWPEFPVTHVKNLAQFAVEFALEPHERSVYEEITGLHYVFNVSGLAD